MIGGNGPFPEHSVMPAIKVIDFGIATTQGGNPRPYRGNLAGSVNNVYDFAKVLVTPPPPKILHQFPSIKINVDNPAFHLDFAS